MEASNRSGADGPRERPMARRRRTLPFDSLHQYDAARVVPRQEEPVAPGSPSVFCSLELSRWQRGILQTGTRDKDWEESRETSAAGSEHWCGGFFTSKQRGVCLLQVCSKTLRDLSSASP